MSSAHAGISLRDFYTNDSARIQAEFDLFSNGRKAIQERSSLVDRIIAQMFLEQLENSTAGLCLVALGGYGRRALFPYSDIDLLILTADADAERRYRDSTRAICQELWDLRLKLSPAKRLLAECERSHRDNAEFNISLLDSRYLAGDERLFARLNSHAIPQMIARERDALVRDVSELTRERHQKEGDTIFHLEPNLKNSPGGLRDYHVACWVTLLSHSAAHTGGTAPESLWPTKVREEMERAFEFLAAARCFLHYRQGRDDNGLTYELQAEAAARGIGAVPGMSVEPADWMRIYFRHARAIYGLSAQLADEALPPPSSILGRLDGWLSRRPQPDFNVVGGRVTLGQSATIKDPARLLSLFEFIAREGVKLSREAEEQVRDALAALDAPASSSTAGGFGAINLWEHLRQILIAPHAADALRAMHTSGLLVRLFPEFSVIDSLVIRDFYHHYTVDAHSFMAIENIHKLRDPAHAWERPFSEIFSELEKPELLFLSLLFHDVGKGMPADDHVSGSLEAVERVFPRLALEDEDASTVRFLIRDHLAMSANLLRRDIFDPNTIRAFAESVATEERLKLLCLFTFADIRAVNPEALTPWKAESLWQFYVFTANYMNRSLDAERIHAAADDVQFVERILPLVAGASDARARQELTTFLEGLPRRYVLVHAPDEVATHFHMARRLAENPVQLNLEPTDHMYVLTVLALDRPRLFAGITGTLASWGMNIWKAEAFANAAGVVVDSFHFTDPYSTLELNPTEADRLKKQIGDVLSGTVVLDEVVSKRDSVQTARPPKVTVPTTIRFDDASSSHSTLMEIVAQDQPGLLYRVSSALAAAGCNIEVALIDTEGQRALDAFYLTVAGAKLSPTHQEALRQALLGS